MKKKVSLFCILSVLFLAACNNQKTQTVLSEELTEAAVQTVSENVTEAVTDEDGTETSAETEETEETEQAEEVPQTQETETVQKQTENKEKEEPDILGLSSLKVGRKDAAGNTVTLIDKEEGLYVAALSGTAYGNSGTYRGFVMRIDDPSRIFVAVTDSTWRGSHVKDLMKANNAVAGINGSGFADQNQSGTGTEIIGLCLYEGNTWGKLHDQYTSIYFDTDNVLHVGLETKWKNARDGIQFGPAVVRDGKAVLDYSQGSVFGLHPRTAIGQCADGSIVFVVVDGRVDGWSVGCALQDLPDIFLAYNCVTAGCCDGGASSVLCYEDTVLNKNTSDKPEEGRYIPNAILVRSKKAD